MSFGTDVNPVKILYAFRQTDILLVKDSRSTIAYFLAVSVVQNQGSEKSKLSVSSGSSSSISVSR